jgi:hypothetical protein
MVTDWQSAPEDAEFCTGDFFYKIIDGKVHCIIGREWLLSDLTFDQLKKRKGFEKRPQQWPETDERINNIGLNRTAEDMGHYNRNADEALNSELSVYSKPTEPKTAVEFLNACAAVQSERGKQYDASGTGERSFAAAASAFNAATGKSLTGSDVCLLLTMVKLVRQYSSPNRLHHDSLLDGVSYLSLWAEELTKELGK